MTVRIFNEIRQANPILRDRFPNVEVVDLTQGLPDDVPRSTSEQRVLFGGWGPHCETLVQRGIDWLQLSGTGFDGIKESVLAAPLVTCARGASAVPISEYVLTAMLNFAKDFPKNWLEDAPKHWNFQPMDSLAGKTLGLVGVGGIGERIAKLAIAFDMHVVVMRRRTKLGSPIEGASVVASIEELVVGADHIVLAAPGTAKTHHLLNGDVFARMKPGVHIVNIARGTLIDQDALRVALDTDKVGRASLDTVTPEPLPAGHWLYEHPTVRMTPHSSWSTPAFFDAAVAIFCDNLQRYLSGQELLHVIDRHEGY